MKGNRSLIIAAGVVVVLVIAWWLLRRGGEGTAIDLMSRFEAAEKRPPNAFTVEDVTINGETKRSIITADGLAGTRLTFKTRVPDDGWLRVNMALKPDTWDKDGDGVRFRVIVSDGRASDVLFTHDINPHGNQADRKWTPTMVDLSAYASEEVDIIFNTFASPPDKAVGDVRNDLAVWGAPEIVVR